ncbi:MAG TPA: phage tail protein, partial [Thermodesulfovibrio thiophilus]|nr:phage tail protein [Thermodesulfovibrio thiophilus]
MASFNNTIITKKGHALIAKIVAGTATPNFTKIRTSDHQYPSGTNFEELTSLSRIKQTVDVASVTKVSPAKIRVSGVFTNADLEAGYYVRNIGLYAIDPQEGEILYSITTAIEADWMPPQGGISASSILVDIETVVGNADNVNITVNPNATATVEMVNNLAAEIADV